MEGSGSRPDIFVHIDPNALEDGRDNQLDAAVGYLLDELGSNASAPAAATAAAQ
jgi:hypothetical protein